MAGQVWFSIIPINRASEAILNDSRNTERVVLIEGAGAVAGKVIQVVFGDTLEPTSILSFGRNLENNIICDPPGTVIGRAIARRHCSFFFQNRCLILRDFSDTKTTSISPRDLRHSAKWRMGGISRQRAIPEYGDWDMIIGPAKFLLRFGQGMHHSLSLFRS